MKNIVLLGATGSIGLSALNVIRQNKERFNLMAISLNQDLDAALRIVNEFKPESVLIANENIDQGHLLFSSSSSIFTGSDGLKEIIQNPKVDIVISAVSGFAGLKGSYYAIDAGKTTLIANKESGIL